MKQWTAVLILLAAAGIWMWRLRPIGSPSEADLRQTRGIGVTVVETRPSAHGWEVTCRVTNATTRAAGTVVLNVSLLGPDERLRASNPLASVPDLPAFHSRDATFLVPLGEGGVAFRAQAEVTLVRWR